MMLVHVEAERNIKNVVENNFHFYKRALISKLFFALINLYFSIFPYIFSTTFNAIAGNINRFDNIVDNVVNNIANSEFIDNLVKNIDEMLPINIQFKEHKRGYTIQCYLPGVKKEDINLEYYNNYVTLQVKRNLFYSNNENIAVAIVQPGGDINEDYYVENADPNGIRAVLKNDTLNVLIPKSTYISKDTTIVEVDNFKEEQI